MDAATMTPKQDLALEIKTSELIFMIFALREK